MKRTLLALTAASLVFAVPANAKPINSFGGCELNTLLAQDHTYGQTFIPTFSVLKKVRLVLFGEESSSEDTMFQLVLKTRGGVFIAASEYAVLEAGTSYDDAVSGDALTFTFAHDAMVTPGQTYDLEIVRIGGTAPIRACVTNNAYADGVLLYDDAFNMGLDFEFAMKGSGPAK